MKKSTLGIIVTMAVMGFAGIVACSSDSSSSSSSSSSGTPASGGKHIVAAAGGTVSDPSGTATLTIPAGALDKDTDITLKVLASASGVLGSIYDFGPDGTTFKTPATLAIKADATLAPAGGTLAVAMGTNGNFVALTGSTFQGGVASAPVPHFTGFGVVAVAGTGTDAGTDAPITGGNCAFTGTFTLQKYLCGTTDVTAQWKTAIPTETLVVTNKAGGGCTMAITHSSPGVCVEAEAFEVTLISGTSYQFADTGISSCAPASCKFVTNDAPCVIGDRVGTETRTIVAEGAGFHLKKPSTASDLCGGMEEDIFFAP
jgi:hypothetical protein